MLAPSIRIAGGGLRFPGEPCRTELGVQFVALFKFPVGVQRLRFATLEQIAEVSGFGGKAAQELKAFLDARSNLSRATEPTLEKTAPPQPTPDPAAPPPADLQSAPAPTAPSATAE